MEARIGKNRTNVTIEFDRGDLRIWFAGKDCLSEDEELDRGKKS
jgi:hypothetical protein